MVIKQKVEAVVELDVNQHLPEEYQVMPGEQGRVVAVWRPTPDLDPDYIRALVKFDCVPFSVAVEMKEIKEI